MFNAGEYLENKVDELRGSEVIQLVDLSLDIIKGKSFISGKVTDIHREIYTIVAALSKDEDNHKFEIDRLIMFIRKGLEVVEKLNSILDEMYRSDIIDIHIRYRWDCYKNVCSINRWGYDSIEISLSAKCIENLWNSINGIEDMIVPGEYQKSFPQFIMGVNDTTLNKGIGVFFENIGEALVAKMLRRKDVVKLVSESSKIKGKERYKFVCSIEDRNILALMIMDVDYEKLDVAVTINEDKMIDTDRCDFIRDEKLCKAVISLMDLSNKEVNTIFSNK